MLIMRDDQLTLSIADEQSFVDWYVDTFMPEHLSVFCKELTRETRQERVIYGRNQAIAHGFATPINQAHFVTLMWDIGPSFYTFPGYKEITEATEEPESNRIDQFYNDITDEQDSAATLGADEQAWHPTYPQNNQRSQ